MRNLNFRRADKMKEDRLRLYRGIPIGGDEFIYGGFHIWEKRMLSPVGDVLKNEDISYVIITNSFADWNMPRNMDAVEVIPESLGEFSGHFDTSDKMIFEGDIVEFEDIGEEGYEYKEGYDFVNRAVVVFENGRFCLGRFSDTNSAVLDDMGASCHDDFASIFSSYCRVIGNIYQNPELLDVCYTFSESIDSSDEECTSVDMEGIDSHEKFEEWKD